MEKKTRRNTPISINLSLYADNLENIVDIAQGAFGKIKAQVLEESQPRTEEEPLNYVRGGYRYMPDSGFILGIPRPTVGDRIVWEDRKTDQLVISEVFEVLERQLIVEYKWIYKIKIDNGTVRGVLK